MNRFFLFLTLLVFNIYCYSQNPIIIEGYVVDSETKEPLSYASVYTDNYIGTITNSEGEFLINIDSISNNLTISYVGYEKATFLINQIPQIINLTQNLNKLPEITVHPIDVHKIVSGFIKKSKQTEAKNKVLLNTFFYRQTTETDSTCNELFEAFLTGNSLISVTDFKLIGGRYATLKGDSVNHYTTFANFFHTSQISPIYIRKPRKDMVIVPMQPDFEKYYNVSVDILQNKITQKVLYKLIFHPKLTIKNPIVDAFLILDPEELTIHKYQGEILNIPLNSADKEVSFRNNHTYFKASYRIENGMSYIESIIINNSFLTILPIKQQMVTVRSILFNMDRASDKSKSAKLKHNSSLISKIAEDEYSPSLWVDNPIIKRSPLEETAISIFKKKNLIGTYKK